MKFLSTSFAALVVLGFAGAASAQCSGYAKPVADQTAQAPVVVQPAGAAG